MMSCGLGSVCSTRKTSSSRITPVRPMVTASSLMVGVNALKSVINNCAFSLLQNIAYMSSIEKILIGLHRQLRLRFHHKSLQGTPTSPRL